MATFKDRLKQLRLEKNLTLKELGKLLGLSESTISLYESGKREPKTSEDYKKIAEFFNVSLDYLLGKSDFKNGRIVTLDELKTFIPEKDAEDLITKHNLQITVDDKELPDHVKNEIIEFLKSKGYLK